MDNNQVAELFTNSLYSLEKLNSKFLPRDYYDRAVDLAIYFNETIEDSNKSEQLIEDVRWAMVRAYSFKFEIELPKDKEGDDANTGSEALPRNSEQP